MSNGFTCVRGCIRHPDGYVVASVNGSGTAEGARATELLTAAFNASTTLATMGYDALECMKALPELVEEFKSVLAALSLIQQADIKEPDDNEFLRKLIRIQSDLTVSDASAILTRLRVQEVDKP